MAAPLFGPMSEKQRRLENARRRLFDMEAPLRAALTLLTETNPSEITKERFIEIQIPALELMENVRRCADEIYKLIEHLSEESAPEPPDDGRVKVTPLPPKFAPSTTHHHPGSLINHPS